MDALGPVGLDIGWPLFNFVFQNFAPRIFLCSLIRWFRIFYQSFFQWYDSNFSDPIQFSLTKFWFWLNSWLTMAFKTWFKSTHDSKWFSGIRFKSTHDSNGFQNFDSNRRTTHKVFQSFDSNQLTTQKAVPNFDSDRLTTQTTFWNFDSNQLMTQSYHYDWVSVPLDLTSYDLFWASSIGFDLVWPFLGFRLECLPEKWIRINSWLKQYLGKLNQFNSWLKRLSRELT